jgi:hypothetical protein
MFDWLFRPSCPCDAAAKNWVEDRLEWLSGEFPESAFSGCEIILPTTKYFANPRADSVQSVQHLLVDVCEYMGVDRDGVRLEITSERNQPWLVDEHGHDIPGAAGTFQDDGQAVVIRLNRDEFADVEGLIGTMAHELAHVRLLAEGRLDVDEFDNELTTDLTTVHLGMGIFLANSPRIWHSHDSRWPNSDLIKPEYMTPPMFGWAFAHLAWFRGESQPEWARYLSSSSRANLRQGLRYLTATRDSWYRPR